MRPVRGEDVLHFIIATALAVTLLVVYASSPADAAPCIGDTSARPLVQPTTITSSGVQYTAPAGETVLVSTVAVRNTSAITGSGLDVRVDPAGAPASVLVHTTTVAAQSTFTLPYAIVLDAGDQLNLIAGTADQLTAYVAGRRGRHCSDVQNVNITNPTPWPVAAEFNSDPDEALPVEVQNEATAPAQVELQGVSRQELLLGLGLLVFLTGVNTVGAWRSRT